MDDRDLNEPLANPTSRRRVLQVLFGSAVLALHGRGAVARADQGGGQLVGTVVDLPPGSAVKVKWEDQPVLVLHTAAGVVALSAICTHQDCVVDWDRERQILLCPCHGSEYAPDGKVLQGPAPAPLFHVPVVVRDGRIYLETGS